VHIVCVNKLGIFITAFEFISPDSQASIKFAAAGLPAVGYRYSKAANNSFLAAGRVYFK
jgi:hypothetical protein